jgi:hypothetical protein
MSDLNPTVRVQFNTLKIICAEAGADLSDRLAEARATGNKPMEDAIVAQMQKLIGKVLEIRKAEIAYLNSTLADDAALKKLQSSIRAADAGLKRMQKLTTVLDGAAKLLTVLGKLAKQFV